jgi:hypothetical protein
VHSGTYGMSFVKTVNHCDLKPTDARNVKTFSCFMTEVINTTEHGSRYKGTLQLCTEILKNRT